MIPNSGYRFPLKKMKYLIIPGKEGIKIGPFGSSLKSEFIKSNGFKVYGQENIIGSDFTLGSRYIDGDKYHELEEYNIKSHDIIITMMGTTGRCEVVPLGIEKGIIDSHLIRLRINSSEIDHSFLAYQVSSSQHVFDQFKQSSKGSIMEGLNSSIVKSLYLYLPPLPIQKAIASYLDKETARIDVLIEKKELQIELLQEKRQAIITRAVTKGLNPNAKMKDSGIEWIGEIPVGWETRRLRYIVSMRSGTGITAEDIEEEGDYPVFGGNGFRGYCQEYTHEGSFVLIGRQGALCGNINYASGKFWASEHAVVATPVQKLETIWLGEIMRIMNLNQYSISAAQPGLAIDRIKDLIIPVPTYREQEQISVFISDTIKKSNEISQLLHSSILLLNEYRSSLITATVSGQIDVSQEVTQ